jgi:hypothetical protein
MSENNGNPTTKDNAPSTSLTLTITWDQLTGACNVTGPIQNYVICCGMMEAAKDVVRKYIENAAKGVVIAQPSVDPRNLRM